MTDTNTSPSLKNAIPWSIIVGLAPFIFMSGQSYFVSQHNKEQVTILQEHLTETLEQVATLRAELAYNRALLSQIDKKLDNLK
jgi:hypothetical protein